VERVGTEEAARADGEWWPVPATVPSIRDDERRDDAREEYEPPTGEDPDEGAVEQRAFGLHRVAGHWPSDPET
jgi:hypothetical protein